MTAIIHDIVPTSGTLGLQVDIMEVTGPNPCDPADRTSLFCASPGNLDSIEYGPVNLPGNTQYLIAIDGYSGTDADFLITLLGDGFLPVSYLSFTGHLVGNDAHLRWTTASELNNMGFELQRKPQHAQTWESIGWIEGNGTTYTPTTYTWRDNDLLPGQYFYRLKQMDFDGTTDYSNLVMLQVGQEMAGFSVGQNRPNPFTGETMIPLCLPEPGDVSLKVYDQVGKLLFSSERSLSAGDHAWDIDGLSEFTAGVYYYRVDYNGQSETLRMVKTE